MTRDEAISRIKDHKVVHKMNEPRAIYISEALDMAIKALEQEPRLKAKWIDNSDGGRICNPPWNRYTCSNCGRHSDMENYCCNCGAEIEDEE